MHTRKRIEGDNIFLDDKEIIRPLTIAFIGYTYQLGLQGLEELAKNNKEEVEKKFKKELYLKDGTRIIAVDGDLQKLNGRYFDQLILFDDNRWKIYDKQYDLIQEIIGPLMAYSCVPNEFKILQYEDALDERIKYDR